MKISIAKPTDIKGILGIYGPIVEGSHTSFEYTVPTHAEMRQRLEETLDFYPWIVARNGAEVSGFAYASRFRKRKAYDRVCEVSVYVHADHQRIGVGKALYEVVFRILRRQGMTQCIAGISLPNPGSIRFHERCGFREIGTFMHIGYKFGGWHDVLFMQLTLSDRLDAGPAIPWHSIGQKELAKLGIAK